MKKLLLLIIVFPIATMAQKHHKITITSDSNYILHDEKIPKYQCTGTTVTLKSTGEVLPLYITNSGKLFYWRTKKNGKDYKVFL